MNIIICVRVHGIACVRMSVRASGRAGGRICYVHTIQSTQYHLRLCAIWNVPAFIIAVSYPVYSDAT